MANLLARASARLTAQGHQVAHADILELLPAGLGRVLRSGYHVTITRTHLAAQAAGFLGARR